MQKIIEIIIPLGKFTPPNTYERKINNFNFFRTVLALLVIFSHSYELIGQSAPSILNRSPGNFAVHCFFVMSGYFIMHSWNSSQNATEYILKRFFRIIPELLVGLVLADVLSYLCHNYVNCPTPYIKNGVIWTLYYEIILYIAILIIGVLRLNNKIIIGSMYLVSFILIIAFQNNTGVAYEVIVPMFFLFLGGLLICVSEEDLNLKPLGIASTILLFVINFFPNLLGFLMSKIPLIYGPDLSKINYYVYLFCLPFSLIYLGKLFSIKLWLKIDLSYGLYMYAWPIQQSLIFLFIQHNLNLKPLIIFVLSSVITLLLSIVAHIFVEKPVSKVRKVILGYFR